MKNNDFDTTIIKYFKVNPDYIKEQRKQFKRIRKGFIKFIAYEGEFDGVLDKNELRHAKKKGVLPPYLDIHHIVPLSGGGTSEFNNLVVVTKSTHKYINKNFFQPQLVTHLNDRFGSVYEVTIPIFSTHVDSGRIIQYKQELIRQFIRQKKFEK